MLGMVAEGEGSGGGSIQPCCRTPSRLPLHPPPVTTHGKPQFSLKQLQLEVEATWGSAKHRQRAGGETDPLCSARDAQGVWVVVGGLPQTVTLSSVARHPQESPADQYTTPTLTRPQKGSYPERVALVNCSKWRCLWTSGLVTWSLDDDKWSVVTWSCQPCLGSGNYSERTHWEQENVLNPMLKADNLESTWGLHPLHKLRQLGGLTVTYPDYQWHKHKMWTNQNRRFELFSGFYLFKYIYIYTYVYLGAICSIGEKSSGVHVLLESLSDGITVILVNKSGQFDPHKRKPKCLFQGCLIEIGSSIFMAQLQPT